ncbi:MAG: AsmA family protein [Candidatus Omnitrophica bacterium]|nr:AsmA family protein [Candidatus Omnitrophota bacterium]
MKKIIGIFVTIILVVFILLTAGFIYLKLNATTIVNKKLVEVLPGAKIDRIEIKYPLTIRLYQISLDKLAEIKEIDASLNILGLLSRKLIISNLSIIEPRINIVREKNGALNIAFLKSALSKKEAKDKEVREKISLIIVHFIVQDGVVYVTDKREKGGFKARFNDINLVINNLVFPNLTKTNFKGGCKISMGRKEGEINTDGWIDMLNKSMDGTITIKNVNLIYFNRFLSLLLLKDFASANLDALIELNALDNDLNIVCHLDIYNIFLKRKEVLALPLLQDIIGGGQAIGDSALSILFSTLKPEDNRIKLDFVIETKLDAPVINKAVLQKAIIEEVKKRLSSLPADMLKGKTEGIFEAVKGEIKDAGIDVIKDTLKNLRGIFK